MLTKTKTAISLLVTLAFLWGSCSCMTTAASQIPAQVTSAPAQVTATSTEFVASGQVSYQRRLSSEEKKLAYDNAKQAVISGWINAHQPSYQNSYDTNKGTINANIDAYLEDIVVVDEVDNKDLDIYTIYIRAKINRAKLDSIIGAKPVMDGTQITIVFVAREYAGKSEDGRTNMTDVAEKIEWRVSRSNEVNVAMSNVFTNANYEFIDAELIEYETNYKLEVAKFERDYQTGNDVSARTRSNAVIGLKGLDPPIDFLAIGTLDVTESRNSNVTGNVEVFVSVTGKVMQVSRRGATVASVGPVQYSGEGPNYTVAKNNALILAANEAAKVLVAQLSSKNI